MERIRTKRVKVPTALLVLASSEQKERLKGILSGLGAACVWVQRCWEARELLETQHPQIVVTDATLEDANWCDVLRAVVDRDPQASVVVVAPPCADEVLWSEVMWRGAHDMLVEPFNKSEARRVLEGALRAAGSAQQVAVA